MVVEGVPARAVSRGSHVECWQSLDAVGVGSEDCRAGWREQFGVDRPARERPVRAFGEFEHRRYRNGVGAVAHRHLAAASSDWRRHDCLGVEVIEQQCCADNIGNRVVSTHLVEVGGLEVCAVDGGLSLTEQLDDFECLRFDPRRECHLLDYLDDFGVRACRAGTFGVVVAVRMLVVVVVGVSGRVFTLVVV